jgi:hypothetical protein
VTQHPQRRHSAVDVTLTSILSAVAGLAALTALGFSMFFAMATDSCDERCNYSTLDTAYLVTWGGVAIAVVGGASGLIVAAKRGRPMWIWPALALVVIAASTLAGAMFANSVMHHG